MKRENASDKEIKVSKCEKGTHPLALEQSGLIKGVGADEIGGEDGPNLALDTGILLGVGRVVVVLAQELRGFLGSSGVC